LESLLLDELGFNSEQHSLEHECDAQLLVDTGGNPSESFTRFWSGYDQLESLGRAIGFDESCSNSSLRLISPNKSPLESDWYEIRIDPSVHSPNNHYLCVVVFRNPQQSKVFNFIDSLEPTINKLIAFIEESR